MRELAVKLAVNQNTVLKVYNELCREKILTIERGDGTYVSSDESEMTPEQRQKTVAELLRPAVVQAVQLQLTAEEVRRLIDAEFEALSGRESSGQ